MVVPSSRLVCRSVRQPINESTQNTTVADSRFCLGGFILLSRCSSSVCFQSTDSRGLRSIAMYAYNLFRSTGPDGLSCAVPEERSVPPFVVGPHWRFEGRLESPRAMPLGFDKHAAATGVRFNGF